LPITPLASWIRPLIATQIGKTRGLKKGGKSLSPTKVITMDAQQVETFLATNR
jgi:hypothetical protein